jgi:hypothetical protein
MMKRRSAETDDKWAYRGFGTNISAPDSAEALLVAVAGSQCSIDKSKKRTSLSTQRSSGLLEFGVLPIPPKTMS